MTNSHNLQIISFKAYHISRQQMNHLKLSKVTS